MLKLTVMLTFVLLAKNASLPLVLTTAASAANVEMQVKVNTG